jgi:dienelactone hydrolase
MRVLFFGVFFVFSLFVMPGASFAQDSINPCNISSDSTILTMCRTSNLSIGAVIGVLVQFLFVISVILSLGFLVYGGIKWITSGGDKGGVENARNMIIAAIIGLIVVFLSYVVLNLVLTFLTGQGISSVQIPSFSEISQSSRNREPTPFPFAEMTIPYLRSRTYEGRLGELEKLSDNGSYTTYLTSYNSEGLKINGLLTIPTGQQPSGWPDNVKPWPAIVFVHGYIPPTQYQTLEKYTDYVDYLAGNGFVVFKIDLRGHGESEGQPGGGYFSSDYIVDTLNAYAALQNTSFVDPNAIGLWGHSMAGNIVLRSLAVKPTIPAAVIWAGAVYSYEDQRKYGLNDQSYRPTGTVQTQQNRRRELYEKVGSPSATSAFWRAVAPTNYLNDLKGAIEIHHAEDDEVVNIGYSRDLVALLDKTSVPHEFYAYPTGGHNMTGPSFALAMQRTVAFFKKYLTQ